MNYVSRLSRISPHVMMLTGFFHGVFKSAPGAGAGVDVRTNVVRYHILKSLDRRGPHHPTEISAYLRVKKNTLSELLDRMVRDGLVERTQAPDDRRKVILSLTPRGRTAVKKFETSVAEHIGQFLGNFEEDDRRGLVLSLESLIHILMKRTNPSSCNFPY
jgi:DNA-binding MarR family transcriptional regulator